MKNYLIVGASSGIGKQIAIQLANAQNKVYATYCKNEVDYIHDHISYHFLDTTLPDLDFSYLPESIEGVVYCPGSILLKPFERIKPEDYIKDYELNVLGAIKTLQLLIPRLKKSASASIILISSIAVQLGMSYHTVVASSKGAIEGLTRALAAEYAPKIRVNCIAPSLTNTPLADSFLNTEQKIEANAQRHPMKRIGTPEDMANLVEFLLSDKASWITGQIIHIDGGLSSLKV